MKKTIISGLISASLAMASSSHAQVPDAAINSSEVTAAITTFLLDGEANSGSTFNVTNGNDLSLIHI